MHKCLVMTEGYIVIISNMVPSKIGTHENLRFYVIYQNSKSYNLSIGSILIH